MLKIIHCLTIFTLTLLWPAAAVFAQSADTAPDKWYVKQAQTKTLYFFCVAPECGDGSVVSLKFRVRLSSPGKKKATPAPKAILASYDGQAAAAALNDKVVTFSNGQVKAYQREFITSDKKHWMLGSVYGPLYNCTIASSAKAQLNAQKNYLEVAKICVLRNRIVKSN